MAKFCLNRLFQGKWTITSMFSAVDDYSRFRHLEKAELSF